MAFQKNYSIFICQRRRLRRLPSYLSPLKFFDVRPHEYSPFLKEWHTAIKNISLTKIFRSSGCCLHFGPIWIPVIHYARKARLSSQAMYKQKNVIDSAFTTFTTQLFSKGNPKFDRNLHYYCFCRNIFKLPIYLFSFAPLFHP